MMRRQFVVPDDLLQRLQTDADQLGVNISAALVLKLSQAYGLDVDPPKHGGRRMPRDKAPAARVQNTPMQPHLVTAAEQSGRMFLCRRDDAGRVSAAGRTAGSCRLMNGSGSIRREILPKPTKRRFGEKP